MRKELFFKSASKLAWYGGIMEIKQIELAKEHHPVLSRAKYHKDGRLYLDYDYIYEKKMERVVLNQKEQCIEGVNAEGISAPIRAICALYDFCFDYPYIQDIPQIIHRRNQISWINTVLNEQITDRRTTDAWEIYELLHDWNLLDKENEVMEQSNYLLGEMLSVIKYMYVSKGKEGLRLLQDLKCYSKGESAICVVDLISQAIEAVEKVKRNNESSLDETGRELLDILKLNRKEKLLIKKDYDITHYIIYSIVLPPEILIKAVTDAFELDFWTCWAEIKAYNSFENIWKSSDPASYDSAEYMDTIEFLDRCSGAFKNRSMNSLLVKDVNLIYCCEDKAHLSNKSKEMLGKLKDEYEQVVQGDACMEFSKEKIGEVLSELETLNLFVFEEWVHDFNHHRKDFAYQSAFLLVEKKVREALGEKKKRELKNKRMEIKGLIALLTNIPLRNEILNF